MSQQIIKQPDGLFAIWSSVVDDFTLVGATADEVVDKLLVPETQRIVQYVEQTIEQLAAGEKPYGQFTQSFEQCVAKIREQHGDDARSLLELKRWGSLGPVARTAPEVIYDAQTKTE